MPVIRCYNSEEGKPGYKVENTEGCPHTYNPKNEESRKAAKEAAYKQWYAIEQGKPNKSEILKPPTNVVEVVRAGFLLKNSYGKGGENIKVLLIAQLMRDEQSLDLDQIKLINSYLKQGRENIGDINYLLLGGDDALYWSETFL